MTDRELLAACLEAMQIAQRQTIPTDWRHMIKTLEEQLAKPAPQPGTES